MKCHYLANKWPVTAARAGSLCGTEESILECKAEAIEARGGVGSEVAYPHVSTGCCSDSLVLLLILMMWIGLGRWSSPICCQLCLVVAMLIHSVVWGLVLKFSAFI